MLCDETYRYKVGCDLPGKYRVALDSDALEFGGHGRVSDSFLYLFLVGVKESTVKDNAYQKKQKNKKGMHHISF